MKLPRPAPRASSDTALIPMINVVFLLLVFFMLAGAIEATAPVDASPPQTTQLADPLVQRQTLHIGAEGDLFLDGVPVTLATLDGALSRQADSEALNSGPSLALRADAGTTFEVLRNTMDALREAGVERIELVTVQARR